MFFTCFRRSISEPPICGTSRLKRVGMRIVCCAVSLPPSCRVPTGTQQRKSGVAHEKAGAHDRQERPPPPSFDLAQTEDNVYGFCLFPSFDLSAVSSRDERLPRFVVCVCSRAMVIDERVYLGLACTITGAPCCGSAVGTREERPR